MIRAIGATYEPVYEGLVIGATRWPSVYIASGVVLPSVMPKVGTPRSRALRTDSTVSLRQRPKLMRDHQIFAGQGIDPVLQVSRAADRRFGREPEWCQAIGEKPRERSREVHADDENPPRAVHQRRQLDDALRLEARLEHPEILRVPFQAAVDVIGDALSLPRRSPEHRVRRDLPDEMLTQVRREVGEALVAEVLNGADDGGGVHLVALREFAGRKEVGLFVVLENRPDQGPSIAAQLRVREPHLQRRRGRAPLIFIPVFRSAWTVERRNGSTFSMLRNTC